MVPGGGVELDEEVEHAAIRELQEEVCDCLCSVNFAYDKICRQLVIYKPNPNPSIAARNTLTLKKVRGETQLGTTRIWGVPN